MAKYCNPKNLSVSTSCTCKRESDWSSWDSCPINHYKMGWVVQENMAAKAYRLLPGKGRGMIRGLLGSTSVVYESLDGSKKYQPHIKLEGVVKKMRENKVMFKQSDFLSTLRHEFQLHLLWTHYHELYVNSLSLVILHMLMMPEYIRPAPINFPISDLYFIFLLIPFAITEVKTSQLNYFLHPLFGPFSLGTVPSSMTSTCLQAPSAVRV